MKSKEELYNEFRLTSRALKPNAAILPHLFTAQFENKYNILPTNEELSSLIDEFNNHLMEVFKIVFADMPSFDFKLSRFCVSRVAPRPSPSTYLHLEGEFIISSKEQFYFSLCRFVRPHTDYTIALNYFWKLLASTFYHILSTEENE